MPSESWGECWGDQFLQPTGPRTPAPGSIGQCPTKADVQNHKPLMNLIVNFLFCSVFAWLTWSSTTWILVFTYHGWTQHQSWLVGFLFSHTGWSTNWEALAGFNFNKKTYRNIEETIMDNNRRSHNSHMAHLSACITSLNTHITSLYSNVDTIKTEIWPIWQCIFGCYSRTSSVERNMRNETAHGGNIIADINQDLCENTNLPPPKCQPQTLWACFGAVCCPFTPSSNGHW